jgi:hypothetical protein
MSNLFLMGNSSGGHIAMMSVLCNIHNLCKPLPEIRGVIILFVLSAYDLFDCVEIITKVPNYAVERLDAVQKVGFIKSDCLLVGTNDHYAYNGYWILRKQ